MSTAAATEPAAPPVPVRTPHPIRSLVLRRCALGVLTIVMIAIVVYFATLVLPGDAANSILGQSATPQRVAALRHELGLDAPVVSRFWDWAKDAIHGDFGDSLGFNKPVTDIAGERLANSAVLVAVSALVSTVLGVLFGMYAAFRRDGIFDTIASSAAVVANALPEFVVAIFVVIVFAVNVFELFPAVSLLPPGTYIWEDPDKLVLPVVALVIVVTPYVFRMTRAAM